MEVDKLALGPRNLLGCCSSSAFGRRGFVMVGDQGNRRVFRELVVSWVLG